MDCTGCSLPLLCEPPPPACLKPPPPPAEPPAARSPALLMDEAAAHLAVTLQDGVLHKMGGTAHGHAHERLKDLTSRVLNGEAEKPAKLCAAEGPLLLKGSDPPTPPPTHAAGPTQRKASSPELKLQITKLVANGKPHFEAPRFPPATEDGARTDHPAAPGEVRERGRKRKRPVKAKPRPLGAPLASPVTAATEDGSGQPPDQVRGENAPSRLRCFPTSDYCRPAVLLMDTVI